MYLSSHFIKYFILKQMILNRKDYLINRICHRLIILQIIILSKIKYFSISSSKYLSLKLSSNYRKIILAICQGSLYLRGISAHPLISYIPSLIIFIIYTNNQFFKKVHRKKSITYSQFMRIYYILSQLINNLNIIWFQH